MDNALPTHCVTCPTLQSPSLEGAALIRALNCEPVDVSATATGNPGTLQRMQCRRIQTQHGKPALHGGVECWSVMLAEPVRRCCLEISMACQFQ